MPDARHRPSVLAVLRHPLGLIRFLRHPATGWTPRIAALLTLLYVVSPVDAITDVLPVIGWLDDLGVVTLILGWLASQAAEHSERMEEAQTVQAPPAQVVPPPSLPSDASPVRRG